MASGIGDTEESWRREVARLQKVHAHELENVQKRHAAEVKQMQVLLTEMRDRISFYEMRIRELKDSNNKLRDEAEAVRREMRDTVEEHQTCSDRIRQLTEQVDSLKAENAHAQRHFSEELQRVQALVLERETELHSVRTQLTAMSAELKAAQEQYDQETNLSRELQVRIHELESAYAAQSQSLQAAQAQIDRDRHRLADMGNWQSEVERLRRDTARLLQILGRTAEWAEFAQLVQDSGGATYVPNPATEPAKWVPEDAYAAAASFHRQHAPHVPVALFETLLTRLNKVWLRREQARVMRVRAKYDQVIRNLRRQIEQRNPYKEVVQSATISFLKKRLHEKDAPASARGKSPQRRPDASAASQTLLASSLSAVQRLSSHVGALAQENTGLRQQLQTQVVSMHDKRALFAEGAVWMGRYAASAVDRLGEKIAGLSVSVRDALGAALSPEHLAELNAFLLRLATAARKCRDRVRGHLEEALQHTDGPGGLTPPPGAYHAHGRDAEDGSYGAGDDDEHDAYAGHDPGTGPSGLPQETPAPMPLPPVPEPMPVRASSVPLTGSSVLRAGVGGGVTGAGAAAGSTGGTGFATGSAVATFGGGGRSVTPGPLRPGDLRSTAYPRG